MNAVIAGINVYEDIFPKLFTDSELMAWNLDMIENYPKALAKTKQWDKFLETKNRIIKYQTENDKVDSATRCCFIEIIAVQIMVSKL